MEKQVIISIGRQYGTAGHIVAKMVAEKLSVPLYDNNILKEVAAENNADYAEMIKFDEKPKNIWFSRRVGEHTNSIEEVMANMQFELLRNKADSGESFVVVGRCADSVLDDVAGMVSVFITADMEDKISRVSETDKLSSREAKAAIIRMDKKRKEYHDSYSKNKWGAADSYDLCLNISKMTVEEAADFIIEFANISLKR